MNIVQEKSENFAIRIVNLYKYMTRTKDEYILSKQLLRSGTSIGANIAEAQYGISRKDFQAKMYIALKESSETVYWLNLLSKTGYLTGSEHESLIKDAEELVKLLTTITKTTKFSLDEICQDQLSEESLITHY